MENNENQKDGSSKSKLNGDIKYSKAKVLEEQLLNLNQYKDLINNTKDFKCKFCNNSFSFLEFKEHYNICDKNPINNINKNNFVHSIENNKNMSEKEITKNNINFKSGNGNYMKPKIKINGINKNIIKRFAISNSISHNLSSNITKNTPTNNTNMSNTPSSNKNLNKNTNIISINNNSFNPRKLKIKIIKGRIRKDKSGKPYLEYIINVSYNNKQNWNINRRFNQFTNLYKTLKNSYDFQLPESANIFSNIAVFSGLSHEKKILILEKFLDDLINQDIVNISNPMIVFLELNQLFDEIYYLVGDEKSKNTQYNGGMISNASTEIKSGVTSDANSNFASNFNSNFNSNSTNRRFERMYK